jgi:hypothetical protein
MTFKTLRLSAVALLIACLTAGGVALAQTATTKAKTKPKSGGASIESLDKRATDMAKNLLKDAVDISKGYEDAGEYDRAKLLLEVLQKLDPKLPGLKEKIELLTDKSLDKTEFEYELDVARGWSPPVALVAKDRLVRIETTGQYKFEASANSGPEGLSTDDAGGDLVAGLPVGALIGMIVNPDTKKAGKPFAIGAKQEWKPQQPGVLLLKINAPNGHKCTGKLKVQLSGVAKLSS